MTFSLWIENKSTRDAILGAISSEADNDERRDILSKKTTYFSSEIRKRIKDLGILKSMGPKKYSQLVSEIDNGITVSQLIKKAGN
jgi:hypothetical protein